MRRLGTPLVAAAVMAWSSGGGVRAGAGVPARWRRADNHHHRCRDSEDRLGRLKIDAKPGEEIRVVVKTVGKMPKVAMAHNFVLLKAGLAEKDVSTFANEAAMAAKTAYVPPARQAWVLANTPIAAGAGKRPR